MTGTASFSTHYLSFVNGLATFTLPSDFTVEAKYNGTSRLYSGNSEVAPRHTLGVSVRKKLMSGKLLLTASVDNLFDRSNSYASSLEAYRLEAYHKSASGGRICKVSLAWNFSSNKKIKKSKVEILSGSERSRLDEKR